MDVSMSMKIGVRNVTVKILRVNGGNELAGFALELWGMDQDVPPMELVASATSWELAKGKTGGRSRSIEIRECQRQIEKWVGRTVPAQVFNMVLDW